MNRKQNKILKGAERRLSETVRSFVLSMPQGASKQDALNAFTKYNQQWKDYCTKMNKRHRWLKADATAFEKRITLLNSQAERKLQPVKYYGKRLLPVVVIAALVYIITDHVLPVFGIMQYQLFN